MNFPALGDPAAFASRIPGFAGFLFADGSVRFLEDAVDPTDVARMATRAGGDVIGADLDAMSLETHYAWDLGDKGVVDPGGGFTFETPGSHPVFSAADLPLGTKKTIALQVTGLDGVTVLQDTAMVHIVTPPVADLYHLMARLAQFDLNATDNRSLMMPLRQATFMLFFPSPQRNANAIADIQLFMTRLQAVGDAGLLEDAQVSELLAAAQAIITEIGAL